MISGGVLGNIYAICECEEAQEALRQSKEVAFASEDLNINIEICERKIETLKERSKELLQNSLGRRFANRTFENFVLKISNQEVYNTCLEYAKNFQDNKDGQGLILAGPVGTGKTHLAAAITHKIIEDYGIPVEFKTSIELHAELNEFERETYYKYKKCDLLVIDDLGKEKITDWRVEKIFEIVNARYEDYLPTIITTNLSPEEMDQKFGKATFSRLCEVCKYQILEDEDWRRK